MGKDTQYFEKRLFNIVDKLGETLKGDIHIIEQEYSGDIMNTEERQNWRVYHGHGYCFEISKEAEFDDETGEKVGDYYFFYEEWEGFLKINTAKAAIELLKPYIK